MMSCLRPLPIEAGVPHPSFLPFRNHRVPQVAALPSVRVRSRDSSGLTTRWGTRSIRFERREPACPFGIHANKALSSSGYHPVESNQYGGLGGISGRQPNRPAPGFPPFVFFRSLPLLERCLSFSQGKKVEHALYSRAKAAATPASRPAAAWALAPEETMAVGSDVWVAEAEGLTVG